MAEKKERIPANVPGDYYVDSSCIDCDMCRSDAPAFFKRDEDLSVSVVYKQPQTEEEQREAETAMDRCPSNSIGNDG